MTNKERFISLLGFEPPANAAEGALLDEGITEGDAYDATGINAIKKAAISVLELLLSTADTTNNITGWAVKYDRDAILKRITSLQEELDLSTKPTIRAIHAW